MNMLSSLLQANYQWYTHRKEGEFREFYDTTDSVYQ